MDYIYDRRVIVEADDGDGDKSKAKYLIMVRRYTSFTSEKDKIWCSLTAETKPNGNMIIPTTFLLTRDETKKLLDSTSFNSGTKHARRRHRDKYGEDTGFAKWIMDGFASAMTIEEHNEAGNEINVYWQSSNAKPSNHYVRTSYELVRLNKKLGNGYANTVNITFSRPTVYPMVTEVISRNFYIIKIHILDDAACLLFKLSPKNLYTASSKSDVRRFPSEIAALNYCEKYQKRFGEYCYEILHVDNEDHLDTIIYNNGNTLL